MIPIPTSPAELEEALSDPARLKDLWGDPDVLKNYVQSYAENFAKADKGDAAEQVRAQVLGELDSRVQAEVAKYLKDHPAEQPSNVAAKLAAGRVKAPNTPAGRALYHPGALGTKLEGIFDSSGE